MRKLRWWVLPCFIAVFIVLLPSLFSDLDNTPLQSNVIVVNQSDVEVPLNETLFNISVENDEINYFVSLGSFAYNYTILTPESIEDLKNSPFRGFYSGVPDNLTVYMLEFFRGVDGFYVFIDFNTKKIVNVLGVHK